VLTARKLFGLGQDGSYGKFFDPCLCGIRCWYEACGVTSLEAVAKLAKTVQAQTHLSFDGIQAYAGQLSMNSMVEKRKKSRGKPTKTSLLLKRISKNRESMSRDQRR
jgi:hypothetical protein